jgi:hypothetical protein
MNLWPTLPVIEGRQDELDYQNPKQGQCSHDREHGQVAGKDATARPIRSLHRDILSASNEKTPYTPQEMKREGALRRGGASDHLWTAG